MCMGKYVMVHLCIHVHACESQRTISGMILRYVHIYIYAYIHIYLYIHTYFEMVPLIGPEVHQVV